MEAAVEARGEGRTPRRRADGVRWGVRESECACMRVSGGGCPDRVRIGMCRVSFFAVWYTVGITAKKLFAVWEFAGRTAKKSFAVCASAGITAKKSFPFSFLSFCFFF